MSVRTRIAPSPTGMPHIGTIYQALFDFVLARKFDGQFILRIEDTDQSRLVPSAEGQIIEALEYYGLTPDEGPDLGGETGPYRQSERLPLYQKFAHLLVDQGHAYPCFCSPQRLDQVRKQMQSAGKPPMYDQHCRHLDPDKARRLAKDTPHVIRMKVPPDQTITFQDAIRGSINFESNLVDDQVILKSDGFPTYHLAVVVDDHAMGITHVIRGEEWISSTPKHVLLYQYFGWQLPNLIHLPLLRNTDRSKISKRHGHTSAFWYRDQGYLPEAVLNFLATRVWNHPQGNEIFSLSELIKHFEFSQMHIQGPIVDLDKLKWLNGQYIRKLPDAELIQRLQPYLANDFPHSLLPQILPLIKDRLEILSDFSPLTDFFYQTITPPISLLLKKADQKLVTTQLNQTQQALSSINNWSLESIETALRDLSDSQNWPKRQFFMMIRVAVTGKTATPPLFETIQVLGQSTTIDRLNQAKQIIA